MAWDGLWQGRRGPKSHPIVALAKAMIREAEVEIAVLKMGRERACNDNSDTLTCHKETGLCPDLSEAFILNSVVSSLP